MAICASGLLGLSQTGLASSPCSQERSSVFADTIAIQISLAQAALDFRDPVHNGDGIRGCRNVCPLLVSAINLR